MDNIVVSIVTATFRREDLLRRCVESVLTQQDGVTFEHIVVNDSGEALTPADWMDDPRVRVVTTQRTERCMARNTGASMARGDWLYFLDDDDYALPGAFAAMLAATMTPGVDLVYGSYQIQDMTAHVNETITPDIQGDVFPMLLAGESFPTHAMWLRRETFFAVGGFDPRMLYAEDVDLFRRMALAGPAARTAASVAVARVEHPATTTTDSGQRRAMWQQSLEKCLASDEVFPRVLAGTKKSPYWRGRCAREYFASAMRNLSAGRYALACSRALAAARLGGPHLKMVPFLRGLRRRRQPVPPHLEVFVA